MADNSEFSAADTRIAWIKVSRRVNLGNYESEEIAVAYYVDKANWESELQSLNRKVNDFVAVRKQ